MRRNIPVFEGKHDGQKPSTGIWQSLVAAGQEEDLMFRQGSTEQIQYVHYT